MFVPDAENTPFLHQSLYCETFRPQLGQKGITPPYPQKVRASDKQNQVGYTTMATGVSHPNALSFFK